MSKTKQKLQLNRISRDKVNLSSQTITTARACTLHPVLCHEVVPGDHFNVKMEMFNRVDALPVSSFVQFSNKNVAFYVKNSQIWKPYDAFKTGAPYAFGYQNIVPTKKPFVSAMDLLFAFSCNPGIAGLTQCTVIDNRIQDVQDAYRLMDETHDYDYVLLNPDGDDHHYGYTFTEYGRCVYKILFQLGYRIPSVVNFDASVDEFIQLEQSLLPLMAYLSILVNYYVPLKWRSYQFVNSMSYLVDPVPMHFQSMQDEVNEEFLYWWYSVCNLLGYVYYGDDYFTSSMVEPMSLPNGGVDLDIKDPLSFDSGTSISSYSIDDHHDNAQEPVIRSYNSDAYSQYLIYALSCVTGQAQLSAMTLNDVKAATLAKFGYKAESADMVPYILEKSDDTINVSPEISTADTLDGEKGAPIGFKAGQGHGFAKLAGNFHFDSYGTLLFINSIMPNYFYYNGVRRSLLRVTSQEEFDRNYSKLGYQAIAKAELSIDVFNPIETFGFTRKYGDMAEGNNVLGGDFIINSINEGLNSFHFGRVVNRDADNNEAFSLCVTGRYARNSQIDGNQYNRVFVNSDSDPIQQWFIWDIKATRPIESSMTVGEADGEVVETKPIGATLND